MSDSLLEKPELAIDFDGTLTTNQVGFVSDDEVLDPPVDGAIEWLYAASDLFTIIIFTARAHDEAGQLAVASWLSDHGFVGVPYTITNVKPAYAVWYFDDRAWPFDGVYPDPQELLDSEPWWTPLRSVPAAVEIPPITAGNPADVADSLVARAVAAEPQATQQVQDAVDAAGGILSGLENRIKTPASTIRKLQSGSAPADVKDSLRYTAVLEPDAYTAGVAATLDSLGAGGATVDRFRNYWDPDPPAGSSNPPGTYVGVNTVLETDDDGYPFELQFHTPQSLSVQAINEPLYDRLRQDIPDEERARTEDTMRANNDLVPVPPGIGGYQYEAGAAAPVAPVPGTIPGSVDYRPASDPSRECGTCSYYSAGACRMFDDAPVSEGYVCDEWEAQTVTAAIRPVTVEHHNRVLRAAEKRAGDLEDRMVDALTPILERAGRVAAQRFRELAVDHLSASASRRRADKGALRRLPRAQARSLVASLRLTGAADGVTPTMAMVAVKPRPDEAAAIADPDGNPAEYLHVTLAFLGEVDGPLDPIAEALRPVAATHGPLQGEVGGYGRFEPAGVGILLPDVPGLVELRVAVTEALVDAGIDYARDHGFEAHISVDGDPEPGEAEQMLEHAGQPLHFDELLIVRGDDEVVAVPLVGVAPITAAGQPGFCLPAALRTKTDPVRLAVVEATMTPALKAAGLSFDVTNPFAGKVLARSGGKVVDISRTTQLDVMRTIKASYQQGLSIPDTAKAIQAVMVTAAPVRARMIARTELASATNGSSLAATQIVSHALGDTYYKQWMCVPPGTRVRAAGVIAAVKKPYDGELVTITALVEATPDGPHRDASHQSDLLVTHSSGAEFSPDIDLGLGECLRAPGRLGGTYPTTRQFAVTPDHLVLTRRGWIPAGLIHEGDEVVGCSVADRDPLGDPDVDDVQPMIEQIFDAALVAAGMVSAPVYLDGGVVGEKVDVVSPDGGLADYLDAAVTEQFRQLMLAVSDVRLDVLLRGGSQTDRLVGHRRAAPRGITHLAPVEQDGGVALMTEQVGGSLVSQLHPVLEENRLDGSVGDPEVPAELLHGDATLVQFDQVLRVERRAFMGHVYDLTTLSGWFFADGYVAHNTAPGARYPRHEDYDDLDGQTVGLDDFFDVGGAQMQYPGDPDGPPGESINCRCALSYVDDASELTASARGPTVARADPVRAELEEIRVYLASGALTAAGEPTPWTAPAAEEILPVDCEGPTVRGIPATVVSTTTVKPQEVPVVPAGTATAVPSGRAPRPRR